MAFTYRSQPLKSIYWAASIIIILFARLPFWLLTYLLPALRPRPSWGLGRSIAIRALEVYVDILYATSLGQNTAPSEARATRSGLVWIEPAPPELIVGEVRDIASTNGVHSVRVAGFWYGPRGAGGQKGQKASPGERIIYHLHGGGHVMSSAHPSDIGTSTLLNGYLKQFPKNTRVFAVEYRLSTAEPFGVNNPFPAALIDAIGGYRYLIEDVGVEPGTVVLSGDSAGGNMAVALARYITHSAIPQLPPLGGLLLLSPAVDWALTHAGPQSSLETNVHSDFIGSILSTGYSKRALLGKLPDEFAAKSAWISPASLRLDVGEDIFANLPKTLIVAGGAELLLDVIRTFRDRMRESLGEDGVTYIEVADGTHDLLAIRFYEPERTDTLIKVARWLDRLNTGE